MKRVLSCLIAGACAAPPTAAPDTDAEDLRPHRVWVIGVDGLRPDGLLAADTPHLDALLADGVLSTTARTHPVGDTVSGPGWASILTGVDVGEHGVEGNDDLGTINPDWPTFLTRARAAGHHPVACFDWVGILPLLGQGATDAMDQGTDDVVGEALATRIQTGDFDLVFSHFDNVDHAGHASGFSPENPEYLAAIESVDSNVAAALDAVAAQSDEANWLILLVTDHGGEGTSHSGGTPEMRTIPMAVVGGGLPAGGDAPAETNHMDTAPTVLDWLGVPYEGLTGRSWLP